MRLLLPVLFLSGLSFSQCEFKLNDLIELFEVNHVKREIYALKQGATYNSSMNWYICETGQVIQFDYDSIKNKELPSMKIMATTFDRSRYADWLTTAEDNETFSDRETILDEDDRKYVYRKWITKQNALTIQFSSHWIDETWVGMVVLLAK